jgi:hypothetical protein
MVLDLNILNGFTRGDVIVAGDDFINLDKVNVSAALGSSQAELVSNGAGVSLARASTNNLSLHPKTTVEVLPISPQSTVNGVSSVNTSPTPGNIRRFYEGNYYNFIGLARPEGGTFNIQYIVSPQYSGQAEDPEGGLFLEYGATKEVLDRERRKMLDGNPDTFWECEYAIRLDDPLLTITQSTGNSPDNPGADAIQIDVDNLNTLALGEDSVDLVIDLVVTLPEATNVNFVAINPVVFSKSAFIDVQDISTEKDGEFVTVDGWSELRFPKTITPEANEYLTDSQASISLSPNRYNYSGQGIYPFPNRFTKKIKVRLSMSQPASQIYERTYALLKNTIDIETTVTTTTKKGRLRF